MSRKQGKAFPVVEVAWAKAQKGEMKWVRVGWLLEWVKELEG